MVASRVAGGGSGIFRCRWYPHLIAQTAAVLSTADDAQQLLTAAKDKWNACADRKIVAVFEVITLSERALGGA
jgi:hypothetical protein